MKAGLLLPIPLLLIIASCSIPSGLRETPYDTAYPTPSIDAEDLISVLERSNSNLDTFKGIGSIVLKHGEGAGLKARIAWIGATPDRVRIAILSSGHPVVKFALDGTRLYVHDLRDPDEGIRKIPAKDPNLKWLIPVAVRVSDLLSLLAGRVPVYSHHSYRLFQEASSGHPVLLFRKWWWVVEKVYFDRETLAPYRVEVFNRSGSLRYRVDIDGTRSVGGFRIPTTLEITNGRDAELVLSVHRYWPNEPVSPSVFTLQ